MSGPNTFECPECGASLTPKGDAPTMLCDYCGSSIVVPKELRQPQQPAPAWDELREATKQSKAPTFEPKPHRGIDLSGCLVPLIVITIIGVCFAFGLFTDPDAQRQIAGVLAPSPTPAPISRVLPPPLPRTVHYANLAFTIKQGEISNRDPKETRPARQYRSDQAYATLDVVISNDVTSKSIYIDRSAAQLRLRDGKLYQPTDGWLTNFEPQSTMETKLVFVVPTTATWEGAQFIVREPQKEAAVIPLDSAPSTPPYPTTVNETAEAKIGPILYRVTSVSLDLDSNGTRADAGKRFLIFTLHVTNSGTNSGPLISSENFRLIVDGDALAPKEASSEVVAPNSSTDVRVVFMIPANAAKLELQVGEVGNATAKLPVALKPH